MGQEHLSAADAALGPDTIAAVLTPIRHLADAVARLPRRGELERVGAQTLAELEREPLALPAGLAIEWLGVSGYKLTYEGKALYIDPYISRVPLSSLIMRRSAVPDTALLDRFLPTGPDQPEAVGVLVGHTHFDHAVDAPALAHRYGCDAYGSESLRQLMALHSLADRAVVVEPYATYELGPFEVSFTPSRHSKLILGVAVPFDGELTCDHFDRLAPGAYRCGQVWGIEINVAGITLYHQGSADLIDDAIRTDHVDVFLAGIAGRNFSERYWERVLARLDPEVIVPTHYDDFFVPLDAGLEQLAGSRLAELPGEVAAVSSSARMAALPRIQPRA
jgi:L-ascorbate metabolism protein UlaG (beta-lactamase superfamily)